MFEKHLWKSDILSKYAGHRPASLLKMPLFHRCFSNILLRKWNIGQKWVNEKVEKGTKTRKAIPVNISLLKFKKKNVRKRWEICSKITIKTPERLH